MNREPQKQPSTPTSIRLSNYLARNESEDPAPSKTGRSLRTPWNGPNLHPIVLHTTTRAQANLSDAGKWAKTKRNKAAANDTRTTTTPVVAENRRAETGAARRLYYPWQRHNKNKGKLHSKTKASRELQNRESWRKGPKCGSKNKQPLKRHRQPPFKPLTLPTRDRLNSSTNPAANWSPHPANVVMKSTEAHDSEWWYYLELRYKSFWG